MTRELTHASFFSGVGGLDLGLERAGWRVVSFSEIDPYASAVLAERWPAVPNLGDIVELADLVARDDGPRRPDADPDGDADEPSPGRLVGPGHHDGSRQGDQPDAPSRTRSDRGRRARRYGPEDRDVQRLPGGGTGRGPRGDGDGPRAVGVGDGRGEGDGPRAPYRDATLWSGGFPCQDLSVAGNREGLAGARSGLAFAFLRLVERDRPPAILLENVPGLLSSHRGRDMAALVGLLAQLGYGWAYRVLDARYFGVPQLRRRVFIVGVHARVGLGDDGPAEILSVGSRCDRHPPTGVGSGSDAADGLGAGVSRSLSTSGERLDADTQSFIVRPEDHAGGGGAADGVAGRLDGRDRLEAVDLLPAGLDGHRYRCIGNGVVADVAEWIGLRLREALT